MFNSDYTNDRGKNKAEAIQFFRFASFLSIFFLHIGNNGFDLLPRGNGAACAVSFFIIMSGFGSGISSKSVCIVSPKTVVVYCLKKIKKFYPLYCATTLIMISNSSIPLLVVNIASMGG